jgi:hypothetical protein
MHTTPMSQLRLLQSEYSKKIYKAAINQVVIDLVAAQQGLGLEKKRLSKSKNYNAAMLSLREFGVAISKSALQQRVTKAMSESKHSNVLEEVNTATSQSTDLSSLTSMSTTTMISTSMSVASDGTWDGGVTDLSTMSETNNRGCPKGSTASQKRQDKVSERQCLDSIIAKYGSSKVADCKQLGKRVEKGFLSELIVAE